MFSFFEKRIDPFPERDGDMPPTGLFGFCLFYCRPALPWLLGMGVLSTGIAIGQVALFAFLGEIVDWLGQTDKSTVWQDHGLLLLGMGIFTAIIFPGMVFLVSMIQHQVIMGNLPMTIRWRMHQHLLGQSLSFFANEFAGRISTKLMQTALAIRQVVSILMDVFVYVIVYFVSTVVLVGASDWRLTIPLLIWVIAYAALVRYIVPRMARVSETQADARSEMTGRIVDSYSNISTVKLFSHSGREQAYAKSAMSHFLGTVYPMMRLATSFESLVHLLNALLIVSTAGLGILFWSQGAISIGAIAVAVGLALRIHNMSQWVMWEISNLFENIGVVYDGISLMKKPVSVRDKADAQALEVTRGEVTFDAVSFHYGKASGVIEQLNLTIQPGERVGLVGRSGAGKTTLANLLLRLYDVEGGRILIDGQNIAEVTQDSLRHHIAMVSQDTSLLHRSIRDNIGYGRAEATDADIEHATRQAKALEFIERLEDQTGRKGFDAHVGERGVKLSGGQRQRIAIARVFLKDAPILILDEATSALDSEVEAAIQDHLFDLMEGKTVIAIAHRLSTIAAMDRLIVLDQGQIVEEGSHQALLAKGGIYADLWARQTGGFLGDDADLTGKVGLPADPAE